MKLHIKVLAWLLPLIILFAACNNNNNNKGVIQTDSEGKFVPQTDESGNEIVQTDEQGEEVHVHTYSDGKVIVYTNVIGETTLFTDINGGLIQYLTESDGDSSWIVTDASGYLLTQETTPDPTAPKKLKIGFIYNGSVNGSTINGVFEASRRDVERTYDVTTCYIENVLVQQFDSAVEQLKKEGCNLIVAASNHFATACDRAAKNEFDGTNYICFGSNNTGYNQSSTQPLLYQPANICGLVAAYNTDSNRIGIVADNNFYNAKGIVNAFALGVLELPNSSIDVRLNWALSDSYNDTKNAIDNLVSNGCDVIFLYQATEYGISYCETLGVKCIGFSNRMPDLAPNTYLTGIGMNMNLYMNERIGNALFTFKGARNRDGLNTKATILVNLNKELCKDGTEEITNTLYSLIYSEASTVFRGEVIDKNGTVKISNGAKLSIDQSLNIDWIAQKINTVTNFSGARTEDQLFLSDLTVNY